MAGYIRHPQLTKRASKNKSFHLDFNTKSRPVDHTVDQQHLRFNPSFLFQELSGIYFSK